MSSSDYKWPAHYNPGPREHLHALGVIVVNFAAFEASLAALYLDRALNEGMPIELSKLYYFSLDEAQRVKAVKLILKEYEKDASVIDVVHNLLEYFQWCQNCRNHLAHAELYPPMLGREIGTLYLSKRAARRSTTKVYIKLTLDEVRGIGDKIRAGVVQCAGIHIFLRFRGNPPGSIPSQYRAYSQSLPQKLSVPPDLQLSLSP